MDKIAAVKNIASFVVGAGASRIVSGIIKNNTSPEKIHDQVAIASATLVLGSMAAKATKAHTDSMIDEAIAMVYKIREEVKKKTSKEKDSNTIDGDIVENE